MYRYDDIIKQLEESLILCICEGKSEKAILNLLLDKNLLLFTRKDLIGFQVFEGTPYRKGSSFKSIRESHMGMYGMSKPIVLIVQDGEEEYKVKKKELQYIEDILYIITKPEIEMLHVYSLGLYKEYERYCRKNNDNKPSSFLQQHLKQRSSYIKSTKFINELYSEYSLYDAISEHYRKIKKKSLGNRKLHLYHLIKR